MTEVLGLNDFAVALNCLVLSLSCIVIFSNLKRWKYDLKVLAGMFAESYVLFLVFSIYTDFVILFVFLNFLVWDMIYYRKALLCVVSATGEMFTLLLADAIISGIILLAKPDIFSLMRENLVIGLFELMISAMLSFLFGRLLKNRRIVEMRRLLMTLPIVPIVLSLLLSVIIVLLMLIFFRSEDPGVSFAFFGLVVIYFIANTFNLILFLSGEKKRYLIQVQTEQKQLLERYAEISQNIYNGIQAYKHDIHNMLLSMKVLIDTNPDDKLRTVYDTIVSGSQKTTDISYNATRSSSLGLSDNLDIYVQLENVKNVAIKGILYSKVIEAMNSGIQVKVDIPFPVQIAAPDDMDIVRMLGNFLDNAREECVLCENAHIIIVITQIKHGQLIVISNSCHAAIEDAAALFQKGFSSKSKSRGIGLAFVAECLERNTTLQLDTFCHDGIFKQELRIFEPAAFEV
jgi:two-component system sensor histidine kinase AgrC